MYWGEEMDPQWNEPPAHWCHPDSEIAIELDGHCGLGNPHAPHPNFGMECPGTTFDEYYADDIQ